MREADTANPKNSQPGLNTAAIGAETSTHLKARRKRPVGCLMTVLFIVLIAFVAVHLTQASFEIKNAAQWIQLNAKLSLFIGILSICMLILYVRPPFRSVAEKSLRSSRDDKHD
jgi:hypothetical protein